MEEKGHAMTEQSHEHDDAKHPEEKVTPPERKKPSTELDLEDQPKAPDDTEPDHRATGLGVDIPPGP